MQATHCFFAHALNSEDGFLRSGAQNSSDSRWPGPGTGEGRAPRRNSPVAVHPCSARRLTLLHHAAAGGEHVVGYLGRVIHSLILNPVQLKLHVLLPRRRGQHRALRFFGTRPGAPPPRLPAPGWLHMRACSTGGRSPSRSCKQAGRRSSVASSRSTPVPETEDAAQQRRGFPRRCDWSGCATGLAGADEAPGQAAGASGCLGLFWAGGRGVD